MKGGSLDPQPTHPRKREGKSAVALFPAAPALTLHPTPTGNQKKVGHWPRAMEKKTGLLLLCQTVVDNNGCHFSSHSCTHVPVLQKRKESPREEKHVGRPSSWTGLSLQRIPGGLHV